MPEGLQTNGHQDLVDRILASPVFFRANRQARLLRYLVDKSDSGESESLKESVVAFEVFDRSTSSYDPRTDSVVRVEVAKLRARLDRYYETSPHEIRLWIPKGAYTVCFEPPLSENGEPGTATGVAPAKAGEAPANAWLIPSLTIAAGLGLVTLGFWLRTSNPASPPPIQPFVAVLPLADLSPSAAQRTLAAGFTEEITTEVSRSSGIHVVARSSAEQYAGADIRRIGRDLGVHAAIEGSIQGIGNRVKVTMQLVESRHGLQLMNRNYEGDLADVLQTQREIAGKVAYDFRRTMITARRALVRTDWQQSNAYRPYLQAMIHARDDSPDEMRQAIRFLRQAIAADKNFALAWAGLARQQLAMAEQNAAPVQAACEEARDAAAKALNLDARLVEGYLARGWHHAMCAWNWTGAERDFRQASELDPAYLLSLYDYGRLLNMTGKPEEAARVYQQALDVYPTWTWLLNGLGSALIKAGRFEEALRPIEESLRISRGPGALMYRGMLAAEQGNHEEAIGWFRQGLERSRHSPTIQGRMGYSLAKLGRPGESRELIRTMTTSTERHLPALEIAAVHAGLGDHDQAMRWLNKAYDQRSFTISYAKVDYRFRDLRGDSRFLELLRKLRLE